MQTLVNIREKAASLPAGYGLSLLVGFNTVVLLGLDAHQQIPGWLKTAASLFLLF